MTTRDYQIKLKNYQVFLSGIIIFEHPPDEPCRIIRYQSDGIGLVDSRSHSDVLNKLEDVRLINRKECDKLYADNLPQVRTRLDQTRLGVDEALKLSVIGNEKPR